MESNEPKKESGVESPYIPKVEEKTFDYDTYQDNTTIKCAAEILKRIGEHADKIVFNHDATNSMMVENTSTVAQEILNVMIEFKVPDTDLQKLTDSVQNTIQSIILVVLRQKKEFEKEFLARAIGTRDPGTGKYSREYATMGDMFQALVKLREQQGNNAEDYFFVQKKEESSEQKPE